MRLDDARHLTGWILEESDYVSYAQAEAALQEAVQRGWFWRQQRQRLTFATYADQLEELRNYLETTWLEARIEELVAMEIENQLSRLAHQKELIVEEQIWMSRYQPIFH